MFDKLSKIRDEKLATAKEDGGFTLIELLVVVVIIGILIAIAIPLYLNYQKGSNDKAAQSDLRAAVSTLQQCYTDGANTYPAASAVTSTGGTAATAMTGKVTMTCGSVSETANLSDGTVMSYSVASGGAVTMTAYNTNGNRTSSNPYTYSTNTGGSIGG